MVTRCSLTQMVLCASFFPQSPIFRSASCAQPIILYALDRLVKAQLPVIFQRIFRANERTIRHRQPIDQPRQQEAHGRAAREHRKRGSLGARKSANFPVRAKQRAPLGYVIGMVGFEAPRVEANRDVVGQRVGTRKVEINQPGYLVAEKEHIVRKKIGMDYALRKLSRPGFLQHFELCCYLGAKSLPYTVASLLRMFIQWPPVLDR